MIKVAHICTIFKVKALGSNGSTTQQTAADNFEAFGFSLSVDLRYECGYLRESEVKLCKTPQQS